MSKSHADSCHALEPGGLRSYTSPPAPTKRRTEAFTLTDYDVMTEATMQVDTTITPETYDNRGERRGRATARHSLKGRKG